MAISENDVLYVAKLARLSLSPDEVKTYSGQLGQILDFINKLEEVDVSGVEPTASILGTVNVTRPDKSRQEFTADDMLKNAPEKAGNQFKVPKVLE